MKRFAKWGIYFWATFTAVVFWGSIAHPLSVLPLQQASSPEHAAFTPDAAAPSELSEVPVEILHVTIAEDPADLYLPTVAPSDGRDRALPIALMLPGALVDRGNYSEFARRIARNGFTVVVPSHFRSLPALNFSGELAEASQITATLTFLEQENSNPGSPLYRKLDPARMALLGHSHGGFVGLQAIANVCDFPFCSSPFSRPSVVMADVFYGVNSRNPVAGTFIPTPNDQIPVALVQGSLDGIATPDEAVATFNLIEQPPKAIITVKGTNHYGITNCNNPAGAVPDPNPPTLAQFEGIETIAQWTAYFLRAHLYHDANALDRIYGNARPNSFVTITSVFE